MTNHHLQEESVWLDRGRYEEGERLYQEALAGVVVPKPVPDGPKVPDHPSSIVNEIAQARQKIQKVLTTPGGSTGPVDSVVLERLVRLEDENKRLKKVTEDLKSLVLRLEGRVTSLESGVGSDPTTTTGTQSKANTAVEDDDDDDDIDLFSSDDDDAKEEAERVKQERIREYENKKAKKPALIAKSNIILDVKPWDDETDMGELEKCVRSIKMEGLLWGSSKLVPVGYGIKKLQITCVVEDDKVGTDDLEEAIVKFEDCIQSMDIVAFNKI